MITDYLPIFFILAFAIIMSVVMANLSWIIGPKKPTREKLSTYESGMEPIGNARDRFSVKFYMVAVSFIVFDIEIVFLYPWAVSFLNLNKSEMVYSLVVALIFIFILILGLIYELKKEVLKWD